MYFAPYKDNWLSSPHVPMGSAFHCVPQVHALYFGPTECARHLFARFASDNHASYLIISDAQMATGKSEELVLKAVGEILQVQPDTRAFILCTGCQTAFIALDGEALCKQIKSRYNVDCVYLSVNRLAAQNTPRRGRVSVPGGDRFHTRSTLMQLIAQDFPDEHCQKPPQDSANKNKNTKVLNKNNVSQTDTNYNKINPNITKRNGILFLSDAPINANSEAMLLCSPNAKNDSQAKNNQQKQNETCNTQDSLYATSHDKHALNATQQTSNKENQEQSTSNDIEWVRSSAQWETYNDFLHSRNAALIISTAPVWDESAEVLHQKLRCPILHLPISYTIEEIDEHYARIEHELSLHDKSIENIKANRSKAISALNYALEYMGDTPIELDLRGASRPWNLAWSLIQSGFNIVAFVLDGHSFRYMEENDRPCYKQIKEKMPDLVERCKDNARKNDRPKGKDLLVSAGKWQDDEQLAKKLLAKISKPEITHWGYAAITHLADILISTANENSQLSSEGNTANESSQLSAQKRTVNKNS